MKKRLRKKLHKGEFQELGFELDFDYNGDLAGDAFDQFWDTWIAFIESIGLRVGGGGATYQSYFVVNSQGSVSPEQRQQVIDWLQQRADIGNVSAGPLKDAWV